jgi:hypothetical protein
MRRCDFIQKIAGWVLWPLAARAQAAEQRSTPSPLLLNLEVDPIVEALIHAHD